MPGKFAISCNLSLDDKCSIRFNQNSHMRGIWSFLRYTPVV